MQKIKMIKKVIIILTIIFSSILGLSYAAGDSAGAGAGDSAGAGAGAGDSAGDGKGDKGDDCKKGIKLNTNIPGIGNCIKKEEAPDSFGTLIGSLMKIALNITVAVAFIALIASGVMISLSGVNQSTAGKGKELIKKVVLGIVLIGLSGIILNTINPNFFTTF